MQGRNGWGSLAVTLTAFNHSPCMPCNCSNLGSIHPHCQGILDESSEKIG
jgi:hypothetical protein